MIMRWPSNNCPWCTRLAFLAILVGGTLFSATEQGAEIMLAVYGEFVRPYVGVYAAAGMVGGALLVAWCGARATTQKVPHQNTLILFSIIAASVGAFVVVHPGGILDKYRLSPLYIIPLASGLAVWAGAKFGSYNEVYGALYKISHNKIGFTPFIVASAITYVIVRGAMDGQSGEHQFLLHLSAVGAVLFAVVASAVFEAERTTNKRPSQGLNWREVAYWLLLIVPAVPIAIISFKYDLSTDGGAVLQFAMYGLSTVMIVAGAALGGHFNSLKPKQGDKPWFGWMLLLLVGGLIAVNIEANQRAEGPSVDMVLSLTLALIPPTMGVCGALLGAHYSARLKTLAGAG